MFDGPMAPRARGVNTPDSDAGASLVQVPSLANVQAVPADVCAYGIVDKRWNDVRPRNLTIAFPAGGIAPGGAFPPYPAYGSGGNVGSFLCGLVDQSGAAFGLTGAVGVTARAACVLEYGIAAANQKVWFDWRPGAYNVPACEWARASILLWGTAWNVAPLSYPACAAFASGTIEDLHPPTVTAYGSLLAGVARTFRVPANARAFEVENVSAAVSPVLTVAGGAEKALRNYATGQFVPGWSPLDSPRPGATVSISSDIDADVRLTFYLSL